MDIAVPGIVFGSVGTAGQRCTSTRRIIAHSSIYDDLMDRLIGAYKQVRIGDPLDTNTLMGPLIDEKAVEDYKSALVKVENEGGRVLYGGNSLKKISFC